MKKIIQLILMILFTGGLYAQVETGVFYELRNYKSQKAISNDGKINNAAPLIQKKAIGQDGHWEFIRKGDHYQIRNKLSKQYIANFKQKNHGAAMKQTSGPGEGALWEAIRDVKGRYRFKNKLSGLYLANRLRMDEEAPIVQVKTQDPGAFWFLKAVGRAPEMVARGELSNPPPPSKRTPPPPPRRPTAPPPPPPPPTNDRLRSTEGNHFLKVNYFKKDVDASGRMAAPDLTITRAAPSSYSLELGDEMKLAWSIGFKNAESPRIYINDEEVTGEVRTASNGTLWMVGKYRIRPGNTTNYVLKARATSTTSRIARTLNTEERIRVEVKKPVLTILEPEVDQENMRIKFFLRNTGEANFRPTTITVGYSINGGAAGEGSFVTPRQEIGINERVELGEISIENPEAAFRWEEMRIRVRAEAGYVMPLRETVQDFTHRWTPQTFELENSLLSFLGSATMLEITIDNFDNSFDREPRAVDIPFEENASSLILDLVGNYHEMPLNIPPYDSDPGASGCCYIKYHTFFNGIHTLHRGDSELFGIEDGKIKLTLNFEDRTDRDIKIGRVTNPTDALGELWCSLGQWIDDDAPDVDISAFTTTIYLTPVLSGDKISYSSVDAVVSGLEASFPGGWGSLNVILDLFNVSIEPYLVEGIETEIERTLNSRSIKNTLANGIENALTSAGLNYHRLHSVEGRGDAIRISYF